MKKQLKLILLLLPSVLMVSSNLCAKNEGKMLYKDAKAPIEERIEDLLSRMTLKEKVMQLNQYTLGRNNIENNKGEEVKDIPAEIGSLIYFQTDPELRNRMQRHAMKDSRLGIPILFGYDAIHGFRTIFPIPLGQACSWNAELVEKACRVSAQECRMSGVDWTFSPMIDVSRDPRWGRVAEGYGEDPYANGVFAKASVKGYQGANLANGMSVAACLKHYVGYGASEAGRDYVYTEISRQTLWDTYLPPYKMGVDAGAATIMSSFNDISGVPGSANHYTLTEVLRNKWNYKGMVVSDWGAIMQLQSQGLAKDLKDAGMYAMNAGLDMDMMSHSYDAYLEALVNEGKVSLASVDEAVRRVLRVKFQLGLFENPYTPTSKSSERFLKSESMQIASQMASESMVLLKNNGILPLKGVGKIAVMGPMADNAHDMLGCWWGHGENKDVVKLLTGINQEFGKSAEVRYISGCDFDGDDQSDFSQAKELAKWADVVILCMGEKGSWSGENNSHAKIELPEIQQQLIEIVHKAGGKIVLALASGRPVILGSAVQASDAILEIWHPGILGGEALAGILSGRYNPSGKLAMTFPYSQGQIPIYYNRRNSARRHQGFYKDMTSEPLYPFGYGLSYTHFTYGVPVADKLTVSKDDHFSITIPVTNDGGMNGKEAVLWYVSVPYSSITRPCKELKFFEKKMIRKGETVNYVFDVDVERDLGYVDDQGHRFVEAGEVSILVGGQKLKIHIR